MRSAVLWGPIASRVDLAAGVPGTPLQRPLLARFPLRRQDILPLLLAFEPRPRRRPFRLYSVDVRPVPRPYARCLVYKTEISFIAALRFWGRSWSPWGMPISCWPTCRRKRSAMRRPGRQPTRPNISRHHLPCQHRPRAMSGCDPASC